MREVWKLDIVVGIRKCREVHKTESGAPLYVRKWLEVDLVDGTVAKENDWIVQDVCDNWHVMNDDEYQVRKDDEI